MADKSYLAIYDHEHERLLENITIVDVNKYEVESGYWYEWWEPTLTLSELDIVLNYIKEKHPNGWLIENNKIIDVGLINHNAIT